MFVDLTSEEKAMIARGLCHDIVFSPPEMAWTAHAMAAEIASKLDLRAELRHAAGNLATFVRLAADQSIGRPETRVSRLRAAARK